MKISMQANEVDRPGTLERGLSTPDDQVGDAGLGRQEFMGYEA